MNGQGETQKKKKALAPSRTLPPKIRELLKRGVSMPLPAAVEVGDEVSIDRIASRGVVFHGGTRIFGEKTVVCAGAVLGREGPVTVENAWIGPAVDLRGGYFRESVFLDHVSLCGGAQVREGCLLEEESRGGHTVGLKQTILFPFVTLGSLINFCDCLMAGGSHGRDHSEVGSSYIHFNFTPNQDKATPSLVGDVPRGVMLNQPSIFLGGQGGLVGPLRIGYGTVIAAGVVCRTDCPEGGIILKDARTARKTVTFHEGFYGDVRRRVLNNLFYIANLIALQEWYRHFRKPFFHGDLFGEALYGGVRTVLAQALEERVRRLGELAGKMERSRTVGKRIGSGKKDNALLLRQKEEFQRAWPEIRDRLEEAAGKEGKSRERQAFLEAFEEEAAGKSRHYLDAVRGLDRKTARLGTLWLQALVAGIVRDAVYLMPSFKVEADMLSPGSV